MNDEPAFGTSCALLPGLLAGLALALWGVAPAAAQTASSGTNSGAIHFTGSLDAASLYVFRGIVQELDPEFTAFPAGDLGISLGRATTVNFGTWHSLQTGSSGSDGPSGKIHYEEDFYATLAFAPAAGFTTGVTFTAYTSPNNMFNTVKEISFKVAKSGYVNPYGLVAFELSGAADGDDDGTGTYLELGVAPAIPLGPRGFTITAPVKVGLSLSKYYQLSGEDNTFGYVDVGGLVTMPLSTIAPRFGSWNVHGGIEFYTFGDTTKSINDGGSNKVVGSVGLGVSY